MAVRENNTENTAGLVHHTKSGTAHRQPGLGEEIANSITHGIGAALAIAALVLLVVKAAQYGTAWHITSFAIFGSSLVILYLASTLYHALVRPRVKHTFRKFDHMSIYLLIAGTYTPFCLTLLNGWIGWTVLGLMWGCASLGIVFKAVHTGRAQIVSTILYLIMGWAVVFFIKPVYSGMSTTGFIWLVLGGAAYSVGVIFFLLDRVKYSHSVWHMFVLGGSTFHFFSVLTLLPAA